MSAHHVVTTISPPSVVVAAARGTFLNPQEENLITCKGSTIEVYAVMLDGIKSCLKFDIFGTIRQIKPIQMPDKETCSLFVLTTQQHYTILSYSRQTKTVVTTFSGELRMNGIHDTVQPTIILVNSLKHTLFLNVFSGYVVAIPYGKPDSEFKRVTKANSNKAIRFMPIMMRAYAFDLLSIADSQRDSSIATLSGELDDMKTIKTFKYNEDTKALTENTKSSLKVEATTHALVSVPEPLGGLLVIGEYIISYVDPQTNNVKELSIDPVSVTAWEMLKDGSNRCLLGDEEGHLYLFTIETSNNRVVDLSSTVVGQVSRPHCIVDLDNLMFYIGSAHGDSYLIQLIADSDHLKYTTKVLATYSCLGPITDFCLFDYNDQGKQTLVCCSGFEKDASLRVVENGISFHKSFSIDYPLVSDLWSLRLKGGQADSILVSTALDTLLLKPSKKGSEMIGYESYSVLNTNLPTLASAMFMGAIIQVTSQSVRMMTDDLHGTLIDEWVPPGGSPIAIAKIKESFCVVCCQEDTVIYLEITNNAFIQKQTKQIRSVTCLSICLKEEVDTPYSHVAVGFCDTGTNVVFLRLPDFEVMLEHGGLSSVSGPVDLLTIKMDSVLYFMLLLGDGQMYSYVQDNEPDEIVLESETETMVGTYCTAMHVYSSDEGEKRIFVAGQRPTLVMSMNRILFVYSINLTNIFGLTKYNDKLALMTENQLLFGYNDTKSNLHHIKYELPGEMPLRIEYASSIKALIVGTSIHTRDVDRNQVEQVGKIRVLNAQTFQVLDTFDLGANETVESLIVVRFSEYPEEYIFVGTLIEGHEDPNNTTGRILVFTTENSKCELVDIAQLPGAVSSMQFIGNTVVASAEGKMYGLCNFRPDLSEGERVEFKFLIHNNVAILDTDTYKNDLLVGDLMESLFIWKVNNDDRSLELKLEAADNKRVWITAVKFVNESVVIGADDRENMFTMLKPSKKSIRGTVKLEMEGGYHLGTLINRFRKGILRDFGSPYQRANIISKYESAFSFVTVNGSIGTVKTIGPDSFEFFKSIQDAILSILPNIGNLDHTAWRQFRPKHITPPTENNYLDGDILKLYPNLNSLEKKKIIESHQNVTPEDLESWILHLVA